MIDPATCEVIGRFSVGPRPHGLAWDGLHRQLLVADVHVFLPTRCAAAVYDESLD
jgi:hypothetical protein